MNKKVGILGLLAVAAVGFFHPAIASAQDRDDYRRDGYAQRDYRQDSFRVAREREGWRQTGDRDDWRRHEWREDQRYDRRYVPYATYGYGYRAPAVRFGFGYCGR